jgi:hypothetical protein
MPAQRYPFRFPCPLIEGFSIDVDAGLIRSKEGGMPHQRRVVETMPHSFKCRFVLSIRDWAYWQEWMQNDGRQWFLIELPSMYAGLNNDVTWPHLVRIMSPITIDARTHEYITASVTFELAPSMFKDVGDAVIPTGIRIVAHSPAAPATPDWVIAKTPVAPSSGYVLAGTPAIPAA